MLRVPHGWSSANSSVPLLPPSACSAPRCALWVPSLSIRSGGRCWMRWRTSRRFVCAGGCVWGGVPERGACACRCFGCHAASSKSYHCPGSISAGRTRPTNETHTITHCGSPTVGDGGSDHLLRARVDRRRLTPPLTAIPSQYHSLLFSGDGGPDRPLRAHVDRRGAGSDSRHPGDWTDGGGTARAGGLTMGQRRLPAVGEACCCCCCCQGWHNLSCTVINLL